MSTLDPTLYSFANPLHVYDPDDPPTADHLAQDRATLEPSEFLCAGEHPAREVEWLWPDRIPLGKVSLLIGNPGLGKSLLTIDMAARVTRGLPFPIVNDSDLSTNPQSAIPNPQSPPPGSVLILSASDDLTDTIRPRLDAAGANANRVFVLPKIRDLRTDFAKLRAAVEAAPNCRLVIVDPVNAYVGPSDSHFHTVVRRVLEPLAELAAEKNLAILAVTHLRKNDGAAIQRAAGSMGFVSMARTIWTIAEDPKDPTRRLFLPLKNNLGPDVSGLAFRITSSTPFASSATTNSKQPADEMTNDEARIADDPTFGICHSKTRHSSSPLIAWDDTPILGSPREVLAPPKPARRPTERDAAREFLRHALAEGPRPASDLFEEAKEQGLTPRTLQRAFRELDGHTVKEGWRAGWWWSLGEHPVEHIASWEEELPDFSGPPTFSSDVGYLDALRRSIDMERFQAVTGRKHLSPSLNLSPSQNPRRSTAPPPPDHLSSSEELAPSNPQSAIHNPKSASTPTTVEDREAVRTLSNEFLRQLKQSRPTKSPPTPPPPPENDIINGPPLPNGLPPDGLIASATS